MNSKLMNELEKQVIYEDLPESGKAIADVIGLKGFMNFSALSTGEKFYIPTTDYLLSKVRNQAIKEEFNGENQTELAKKYGIGKLYVENIVKGLAAGR